MLERVNPADIRNTALLTVEGELDDISGKGQSEAAHDLCAGIEKRHHIEVLGAGHYGIFSGRRWREKVYPELKQFILDYQPKPVTAETKAAVAAPVVVEAAVLVAAKAPAPVTVAAVEAAPAAIESTDGAKPVANGVVPAEQPAAAPADGVIVEAISVEQAASAKKIDLTASVANTANGNGGGNGKTAVKANGNGSAKPKAKAKAKVKTNGGDKVKLSATAKPAATLAAKPRSKAAATKH